MLAETMMYVREAPWSGLGTGVETAPTSADAIKLAGLDWSVISKPIYDADGNEIPNYRANTRSKDNSVLGIVTPRYQIVQNVEAFSFTDEILKSDKDVHYETAGSLRDGKTIWLLAKMEDRKILGDEVDPYICFTNTHDGTGSIKICMTPVRVWCQNTLNLALRTAKRSWTTKHIGNISAKLEQAKMTLGFAEQYMDELEQEATVLVDTKIENSYLEQLIDIMYPVDASTSERKLRNIQDMKDNIYMCYGAEDIKKFKDTAWGAVNAVSDFVSHIRPSRMTTTYQANNWSRIMVGHPMLDLAYQRAVAR